MTTQEREEQRRKYCELSGYDYDKFIAKLTEQGLSNAYLVIIHFNGEYRYIPYWGNDE